MRPHRSPYLIVLALVPFLYNQTCISKRNNAMHVAEGGKKLLSQFQTIVKGGTICNNGDGTYYFRSISSTMPTPQFAPSHPEIKGLISFSTGFDSRASYIRNIWDSAAIGFTFYGHCVPSPNLWPFKTNAPYCNDVFVTAFIPVDVFRKNHVNPILSVPDYPETKYAIKISNIRSIESYGMCSDTDVVATDSQYKTRYNNINQVLGIIACLKLLDNTVTYCYIISKDNDFNWKALNK